MKILFLFILTLCLSTVVTAQSRSELERQRTKMLAEIAEAEQILNDVKKNKIESTEQLDILDKKISTRNNLILNITKDISKVELNISNLEDEINKLSSNVMVLKKEYARVLWLTYLNRQKFNHLLFVLSATDFNQGYRRLMYVKQYSVYRKRQIKAIQDVQVELTLKLKELDNQKKEKSKLLSKAESENRSLSQEMEEKQKLVNSLKSKEKSLLSSIKEKNRRAEKLKKEIENLIRKEIEANNARLKAAAAANKKSTSSGSSKLTEKSPVNVTVLTPDDAILAANFKDNKGKLPWPTEKGVITGFFGERVHPVYKFKIQNNGVDITTIEGSTARSIFEGKVIAVVPILGANFSVIIRHGNYFTTYSNLIDVVVKPGEVVKTKQIIGKVFTDRFSSATILHFEVYDNLKRLDPQYWLNKN